MKLTARLFLLPFFGLALASPAQEPAGYASWAEWARMKDLVPRHYVCRRASGPVVIDGRLDDAAWQNAPWTEDFADIEGPMKPKPRFRTRAELLWDDEYLYVGAELEEPNVWATLTKHDSVIFNDPDFEVFIDPDGDCHDYYEFEMNALNTGWDLLLKKPYKDGGPALNEWDIAGLKTHVSIRGTINNPSDKDEGWTVEIAFPWKALAEYARTPAPPRDGDQWRIDFSRVEWDVHVENGKYVKAAGKREDNWVWSPQGIIDMHRPEQWGFLQFSTNTTGEAAFHPDPAFDAKRALQGLYYAQRDFRAQTGRWAANVDELSKKTPFQSGTILIDLKSRPDGYVATATAPGPDGSPRVWHIRQDARVWSD